MSNNGIGRAIESCFTSPNVSDSNFESANIVDVMDDLAKAVRSAGRKQEDHLFNLGKAVNEVAGALSHGLDQVADALRDIASANAKGGNHEQ